MNIYCHGRGARCQLVSSAPIEATSPRLVERDSRTTGVTRAKAAERGAVAPLGGPPQAEKGPATTKSLALETSPHLVEAEAPGGMRSARETRVLALVLQRSQIPEFTKKDLERRWKLGPDSVRKILRAHCADPGPGKYLLIPLTDALRCEGVCEPLETWISATDDGRRILAADLLTLDEWVEQVLEKTLATRPSITGP